MRHVMTAWPQTHVRPPGHHSRSVFVNSWVIDVDRAVRILFADVRLESGDAVGAEAEHGARLLPEDFVCSAHPAT